MPSNIRRSFQRQPLFADVQVPVAPQAPPTQLPPELVGPGETSQIVGPTQPPPSVERQQVGTTSRPALSAIAEGLTEFGGGLQGQPGRGQAQQSRRFGRQQSIVDKAILAGDKQVARAEKGLERALKLSKANQPKLTKFGNDLINVFPDGSTQTLLSLDPQIQEKIRIVNGVPHIEKTKDGRFQRLVPLPGFQKDKDLDLVLIDSDTGKFAMIDKNTGRTVSSGTNPDLIPEPPDDSLIDIVIQAVENRALGLEELGRAFDKPTIAAAVKEMTRRGTTFIDRKDFNEIKEQTDPAEIAIQKTKDLILLISEGTDVIKNTRLLQAQVATLTPIVKGLGDLRVTDADAARVAQLAVPGLVNVAELRVFDSRIAFDKINQVDDFFKKVKLGLLTRARRSFGAGKSADRRKFIVNPDGSVTEQ